MTFYPIQCDRRALAFLIQVLLVTDLHHFSFVPRVGRILHTTLVDVATLIRAQAQLSLNMYVQARSHLNLTHTQELAIVDCHVYFVDIRPLAKGII